VPFAISAQIRKRQTLEKSVCTTVCLIFGKTATETFRASTHQGNWKLLQNSNFQIFLPDKVEHVEQDCAAHNDQNSMPLHYSWKTKQLQKTGLYY
jgi:hypothetical protein